MRRFALAGLAAAIVLMTGGCAAPAGQSTSAPNATTPGASAQTQAEQPEPTTEPPAQQQAEESASIFVGPETVAGEFNFGATWFGGMSMGRHPSDYAAMLGLPLSACGEAVFPSIVDSAAGWEAFLYTNWQVQGVAEDQWAVKAIQLASPGGVVPTEPYGPVGPYGIRLGTDIELIVDALGDAWIVDNGYFMKTPEGAEYDVYFIKFTDPYGNPMAVTSVEGRVVAMTFGASGYLTPENIKPWCFA